MREKLYLNSAGYNNAKRLLELKKLVLSNGGKIVCKKKYNFGSEYEIYHFDDRQKEPILTNYRSSISFVIKDYYYYICFNDNPFFPTYYQKTRLPSDSRLVLVGEYYMEELEYSDRDIYSKNFDAVERAKELYHILLNQKENVKVPREAKTILVQNLFDQGYHNENKPLPERVEELEVLEE